MKKRLVALFLALMLLLPSALASAAYYRVNTTWLKARRLPSTSATVLDSYRRDFAMTVKARYDGGWAYVVFTNGKDAYVQTAYIKSSSSYTAYITQDGTSLRTGPAYSFTTVGTLSRGKKVTVLSHGSSYDYIKTSVGYGYVRNSLLSKSYVKPSGTSSSSSDASLAGAAYIAYVTNPNGRAVNMRRGPGKNYEVIAEYRPGTAIGVLSSANGWTKIKVNGIEGYMMNEYITKAKPAGSGSSSSGTPKPAGESVDGGSSGPSGFPYTAYITSPNGGGVNIHRGPGMGYANVTRASVGTKVSVVAWCSTKWSKITINGRTGYVLSQYLTRTKP